jgi:hypothetical protein
MGSIPIRWQFNYGGLVYRLGLLIFAQARGVRLPCSLPILYQSVGKSGRSRLPWKEELGGSNPPTLTIKGRPTDSCLRHTRKVGWAAYAGFDGFPDTTKTITNLQVGRRGVDTLS